MSDKDNTHEYVERTADEMALVQRQFRGTGYDGVPYIAPPAPGHDVKGFWHYFPAHTRSGYSAHAIALHQQLVDGLKIPTSLVPHRNEAIDFELFPKDRAAFLGKWIKDILGLPEAVIVSLPPELGMYDLARALVSYVAGPECTKASEHVIKTVVNSDKLTALWCVSPFTARAYLAGGADPSKVKVVRPAICDGFWRLMFRSLTSFQARTREEFVFGTVGTWHERKGFHDLVRAYFRAFRRDQPVQLHIRTSSLDSRLTIKKFEEKVVAEIAEIAENEFGDSDYPASKKQPRIKLITGTDASELEIIEWIGGLDALVNPSYAEGLGIPQMWALAQGVPLVTSDFGAVGEFCDALASDLARPFRHRLVPVPASMRGHAAIWADDSCWGGYEVDDLAASMTEAVKRIVVLGDRQRMASAVRSHFSFAACRESVVDAVKQVARPEIANEWGL